MKSKSSTIFIILIGLLIIAVGCTKNIPTTGTNNPQLNNQGNQNGQVNVNIQAAENTSMNDTNSTDISSEIVVDTPNDVGSLDDLNVSEDIPQ